MPPSIELTREQELRGIDIERVIMDEFNRLCFRRFNDYLDRIFDDYFDQIYDCLRCVGMSKPYTIGDYLKKVKRRCKDKKIFFTSKCIEEIRKELRKYVHFRRGSRRIDDILTSIEKDFAEYEMEDPKTIGPSEKELKSLDLEETIHEIIYGKYEVMTSWCPEFAKTCERILKYSGMIVGKIYIVLKRTIYIYSRSSLSDFISFI